MKQILIANKIVLSKKKYLLGFLALVPVVFLFFVYIPVRAIPGNSLDFQLSIFTKRDYILTTIFSMMLSLFLIMQIFVIRNAVNAKNVVTSIGAGGVGGYVATLGALFGSAACSSCLFAILSFLSISTVYTLLTYQWYIVGTAIFILLISIYFLSKKVNGICESCQIDKRKIK